MLPVVILCMLSASLVPGSLAGRAPTWDICNCHWDNWASWTECSSSCGGGHRQRDRMVYNYDIPSCEGFEKCATNDMGSEYQLCNANCFNGGTFHHYSTLYGYCNCKIGTKGTCCEQIVTCGQPSRINNGRVSGSDFTYGHEITYACDNDYNMTALSHAVLHCTEHGFWSDIAPECIYAASCKSTPCKNQATCTNLLGDYQCTCRNGWTGRNCDIDIQPPVFDNCPDDLVVFTANMTCELDWKEPLFYDPMGNEVQVTNNYQKSVFNFPWGTFTIQYNAVKPSNGLTNECVFNMTIKPYPCKALVAPKHGYVVCNNWMSDFAKVCKINCEKGYILSPAFKEKDWYNCGASGTWIPSSTPSECVPELFYTDKDIPETEAPQRGDCSNHTATEIVASRYIEDLLESNFNSLCVDYQSACDKKNVLIVC